jgi:trk system potassium uptake protein TrkH
MTLGSFIILSRKSPLPSKRHEISKAVFSLPDSFRVEKFIRSVIHFTVVIESLGTLCLYFIFREAGVDQPLWHAVFHSVSSFCTAGFSLYSNSFEQYSTNFWLNVVVAIMSYLGAIGFIVCVDFWRKFRGKTNAITLTSKIILWTTFWMSIIGTTLLFLSEPSTQSQPADTRLLSSFFQCMTAMTTVGFNTLNLAQFSKASLLILIVLMIIGASPSGTGGGLKCTTFSAILGVMRSAIRGEKEVSFWGNPVPLERIWTSVASLGFYLVVLVIGTYLLELTEASTFEENLFEAASALGTVGLSLGITANLTHMGKIVIILLMFCGRLGPLTFGIALFFKDRHISDLQDNDLAV